MPHRSKRVVYVLLLISFLFYNVGAYCQIGIGPALGMNFSQLLTGEGERDPSYTMAGQGGLVIHNKSSWVDSFNLFFQHEIHYFQQNENFTISNSNDNKTYRTRFHYLNWSPNVKVGWGRFIDVFAIGGPRVSMLMGGKTGYVSGGTRQMETFAQKDEDWTTAYNRWQVGAQLGLGMSLDLIATFMRNEKSMPTTNLQNISKLYRYGNVYLNAMYYRSFRDVYAEQASHFSTIYFNVGYIYKFPALNQDPFR